MIKVMMYPHVTELAGESGISRVVEAYHKYLPEFGIELVLPDATSYDLTAAHAGITGGDTMVCHAHGLYWTGDYNANEWEWRVNARVIEACRNAKVITVPSEWVAETIRRDMRLNPFVIPHGIDWQGWQHKEQNGSYVLWNKNRRFDVCDNSILDTLMRRFPDTKFVSTLITPALEGIPYSSGMWPKNFKIIESGGKTPHIEMKRFVQRAGIYLSVAKETFGIGVLEAMASGVPVLGWNWGGNTQLVQHGVNGYLARPGDVDDLCEGLNFCLKYRKVLGSNGRELAKGWTWQQACSRVAEVYRLALEDEPATVSVVIPVFDKSIEQVKRAVESCLQQTLKPKEIIVVNDGSAQSYKEVEAMGAQNYYPVRYIEQSNQGVANARNNGISATDSKYITCLDSDDFIESDFLSVCISELEKDRSLGICYTGLKWHKSDGTSGISDWPGNFDPDKQLSQPKQNQIPTACVFRRAAWERVGGYKSRYCIDGAGSEDAALWTAICSIGYNAKKVTDEPLFNYSAQGGFVHGNRDYLEIDWHSMFPWTKDGLHPFASVATPKRHSHAVSQYDEPAISVIIPVGPGHEKEVINALDSLEMQHFRKWEAIVTSDIFDKASPHGWLDRLKVAYPYIRDGFTGGSKGAGFARNWGASMARAPLLFFLDADDVLADAHALGKMLQAWNAGEAIIYSDYLGKAIWDYEAASKEFGDRLLHYHQKSQAAIFRKQAADYDPNLAQRQPEYSSQKNMPYYHWCLVSVLIPKAWHNAIGGFDEGMETWEDVDYMWRLARAGYCFYRVPEPLVMYAYHKGYRREKSAVTDEVTRQKHQSLIQYIKQKREYQVEPVGCNCGGKRQTPVNGGVQASGMNDQDWVMIEFSFPGGDTRGSYGQKLVSPTKVPNPANSNQIMEYKGYSRKNGDRFLVHVNDQRARPDMFRLIPNEVKAPESPKIELPEPVLLVQPEKAKRGRPIKVAA